MEKIFEQKISDIFLSQEETGGGLLDIEAPLISGVFFLILELNREDLQRMGPDLRLINASQPKLK